MKLPTFKSSHEGIGSALNTLARAIEECYHRGTVNLGGNLMGTQGPDGITIEGWGGESGSTASVHAPWDIFSLVGVGTPNPETGKYSNYKAKVWPGTLNGYLPTNATSETGLTEFTISGSATTIFKVRAATDGKEIQTLLIVADEAQPAPQVPAANAMPSAFEAVFAIVDDGVVYRTIGGGNLTATANKLFVTDKTTTPTFGQLAYTAYYIWTVEG
jgi:hypothetical protein